MGRKKKGCEYLAIAIFVWFFFFFPLGNIIHVNKIVPISLQLMLWEAWSPNIKLCLFKDFLLNWYSLAYGEHLSKSWKGFKLSYPDIQFH